MSGDATHEYFHGTSREYADAIVSTGVFTSGNVAPFARQARRWAEDYGRTDVTVVALRLVDLCESDPLIGRGQNFQVKPGSRVASAEILAPDDPRLETPPSEVGGGLQIPQHVLDRATARLQAAVEEDAQAG